MPLFHDFVIHCRVCNVPEKKMSLGINFLGEIRIEIMCRDCKVLTGLTYTFDDLVHDCRRTEIIDAESVDLAEFVAPPGPPH